MEVKNKKKHSKWNIALTGVSLLCVLLASCDASKDSSHGATVQASGIVNGTSVTNVDANVHSVVAIVIEKDSGKQGLCTGTLVTSNVVLTAAHCVEKDTKKLYIMFGFDLEKIDIDNIRNADSFIQHPDWTHDLPSGHGDLALIHFVGDLPPNYTPVKLADSNLKLYQNQKVFMIGYGVTSGDVQASSGVLRKADSFITDRFSLTEIVSDGRAKSICFGDSGGPAFVEVNKTLVQWGIAQSVMGACNNASIHTEVMSYLEWIQTSIERMEKFSN